MIRIEHYLETIHTKKGILNERTLYALRIEGYSKRVAYIHSSYNKINQAYSLIVTDKNEIKVWEGIHRLYELFGDVKPTISELFTIYLSDHGLLMDIKYKVSRIKILDLEHLIITGHPLYPVTLLSKLTLDRELNPLACVPETDKLIVPKINLIDGELVISFNYNGSIIKLGTVHGHNISKSILLIDNERIRLLKDIPIEIKNSFGTLVANNAMSMLINVINDDLMLVDVYIMCKKYYTFAINIKEEEVK